MQSKLGWGHFSTTWLALDTAHSVRRGLKVQKSAQHYSEAAMDEIKILRQIADGDLEDSRCVVKLLDHFKHTSPNESHVCMVFEFLGDNLLTLIKYTDYRGIPLPMVKEICRHVLIGLDYLHRELSIIHSDLKPENIFLVSTIDPSNDPRKSRVPLVPPAARAIEPPPRAPARPSTSSGVTRNQQKKIRKKAKHVVVSTSEGNGAVAFADIDESDDKGDLSTTNEGGPSQDGDMKRGGGYRRGNKGTRNRMAMEAELGCKLVDFGNAYWTYKEFTSDIQTRQYRCPEVLLGSKYSTSVDLWSFACICFELASGDVLFDPHSGDNFDKDEPLLSPSRPVFPLPSSSSSSFGGHDPVTAALTPSACSPPSSSPRAPPSQVVPLLDNVGEETPTISHPFLCPSHHSPPMHASPRSIPSRSPGRARHTPYLCVVAFVPPLVVAPCAPPPRCCSAHSNESIIFLLFYVVMLSFLDVL
ncbi:hypothetical protein ZWY2020_007555 [Hordeum vulgare]|nr:hypothetical protein ZWY2020_007555 [Hordeum vulgare]